MNKAPTLTSVTTSGSPSDFGSSVTFTAHVTFAPPSTNPPVLPTGTVKFSVDGSAIASRTLDQPTGLASFSTSSLLPGTHVIRADYLGDGNFLSSFGTVGQTVTCLHNVSGSVPGALILGTGSTCIVNAHVGGAVTGPDGRVRTVHRQLDYRRKRLFHRGIDPGHLLEHDRRRDHDHQRHWLRGGGRCGR